MRLLLRRHIYGQVKTAPSPRPKRPTASSETAQEISAISFSFHLISVSHCGCTRNCGPFWILLWAGCDIENLWAATLIDQGRRGGSRKKYLGEPGPSSFGRQLAADTWSRFLGGVVGALAPKIFGHPPQTAKFGGTAGAAVSWN